MLLKNWDTFINEADDAGNTNPAPEPSADQIAAAKQTADAQLKTMTQAKDDATRIKTATNSIVGSNSISDLDTKTEDLTKQYVNQNDTLVTSSLNYFRAVADKRKCEIRIQHYQKELPEMSTKLDADIADLSKKIEALKTGK